MRKKLEIILFVLLILLLGQGCAAIGKQIDYQKACASDPTCLEEAKKDSELVKLIVGTALPAAGGGAGAGALALSLWLRGKKKKDPK